MITILNLIIRIAPLFSLLLIVACSVAQHTDISAIIQAPKVYFSPHGGATAAIVDEIGSAKSEILVQAYSFTSKEISKALLDAHQRGVHIEIILDKSNLSAQYNAADFTAHMGIPTYIDAEHAIAHNKIIIIDGETVITGSFNFTRAAEEKNAENLLIIKSKELAKEYIDNWNKHKSHSQEYKGR